MSPMKQETSEEEAMVKPIEALFDGTVFRPTEPIGLSPNTRVRITIETELSTEGEPASFLRTARALNLDGPPDWSANIDEHL
jgi:predicted DNA-binding antitoxin AbrB/MazE fold protein